MPGTDWIYHPDLRKYQNKADKAPAGEVYSNISWDWGTAVPIIRLWVLEGILVVRVVTRPSPHITRAQ